MFDVAVALERSWFINVDYIGLAVLSGFNEKEMSKEKE